jgi:hypothetical protein
MNPTTYQAKLLKKNITLMLNGVAVQCHPVTKVFLKSALTRPIVENETYDLSHEEFTTLTNHRLPAEYYTLLHFRFPIKVKRNLATQLIKAINNQLPILLLPADGERWLPHTPVKLMRDSNGSVRYAKGEINAGLKVPLERVVGISY